MQTKNTIFDGVAKAMGDAAGVADGIRREAETVVHSQMQRFAADKDLVTREEFEVVREMAARALDRIDGLEAEIAALKDGKAS